ncbi:uncharacterized protein LOC134846669 [Symsagittifera roscoffensis]|uniref:uncharacterized protein LOC134846669 n=1 Tax=Symsagittifera roscoffensis TaxID=84072 RepID=UPI00307C7B05
MLNLRFQDQTSLDIGRKEDRPNIKRLFIMLSPIRIIYHPDTIYDPRLVLNNAESIKKECVWYSREIDPQNDTPWVVMHWRVRAIFFENMELHDFPRDVQDISVYVTSEWGAADIELILDDVRMSTLDMANFRDSQEWFLFRHVEVEKIPEDPNSTVKLGYTAGFIVARCRVQRRIKYYVLNHVSIMLCLLVLSFSFFTFDPVWNLYRIGNAMTLLLVAVTFKLSVAGTLPPISYLTYLDKYIMGGMIYLIMLCVTFALISPWKDIPDKAEVIDRYVIRSMGAILITFHSMYALQFYIHTNKKINQMKRKDHIYLEQLAEGVPKRTKRIRIDNGGSEHDSDGLLESRC